MSGQQVAVRDRRGGELVRALERAWAAIREQHADVPEVVIVTGPGSSARRRAPLRLGQFAAERWHPGPESALGEVMIGGEGLERGADAVLGTLLHEAVHAVAQARGVKETSRQGRYHNSVFREIASELGLQVERHPTVGWSLTTLPSETAERYRHVGEELDRALDCGASASSPTTRGRGRRAWSLRCAAARGGHGSHRACSRAGRFICSICEQPFRQSPARRPVDNG